MVSCSSAEGIWSITAIHLNFNSYFTSSNTFKSIRILSHCFVTTEQLFTFPPSWSSMNSQKHIEINCSFCTGMYIFSIYELLLFFPQNNLLISSLRFRTSIVHFLHPRWSILRGDVGFNYYLFVRKKKYISRLSVCYLTNKMPTV